MGGWGSGRQGGRVTIGGCGSYRLALKDLGDLLRSPANKAVWLSYGQNGEHRMTVVVEAWPEHGYVRLQHPSRASDHAEHMDYTVGLTSTAAGAGGFPARSQDGAVRSSTCRAVRASSAAPRAMAWPTA